MADIPIGAAIQQIRTRKGWTQGMLAAYMKCPRPYVSKVERGMISPDMKQVNRFAVALKMATSELVGYAEALLPVLLLLAFIHTHVPMPKPDKPCHHHCHVRPR